MGTMFVGVADDPSAILFNPGGLTQTKGTVVYGGITAIAPSTEYKDLSGSNSTRTESQVFFPPHLYVAHDFEDRDIVFGLGLYSPFGIGGREWDASGPTRSVSVESGIATFSVNPTIAWRLSETVSLALGVDYLRSMMDMKRMIDQSSTGAGDASSTVEADGDGWGYNLGMLAKMGEAVRVGFAYRSAINVNNRGEMTIEHIAPAFQPLFGGETYKTGVSTSTRFPEIYSVGISFTRDREYVVGADVELVRWSSFKRMNLDIDREVAAAGLVDAETSLDWKDSWQMKFGAEFWISDAVALRAGYAFINSPVPDHTLEPGNPDADQHNISIGAGYRAASWWIDGFYDIALFRDRSVRNGILDGTYANLTHYAGVSVGKAF
jgi:long-chain fatty acid transport protein